MIWFRQSNKPKRLSLIFFPFRQVFRLDVIANGVKMTHAQILAQLLEIHTYVDQYEASDPAPIAIMTADNRRLWAQNRQILMAGTLPSIYVFTNLFSSFKNKRNVFLFNLISLKIYKTNDIQEPGNI